MTTQFRFFYFYCCWFMHCIFKVRSRYGENL